MQRVLRRLRGEVAQQQEQLMQLPTQRKQIVFQNRLFITSLLNSLSFLTFIFSMCYYEWALIEFQIYILSPKDHVKHATQKKLWVNLVYGKDLELQGYQSFPQLQHQTCFRQDIYCYSMLDQLAFTGYISFGVFMFGAAFQIYDIYKTINYLIRKEEIMDFSEEIRDNLRHFITVGNFLVGITLNIFAYAEMKVLTTLGVSFWVFVGGLTTFLIVIVYEQISLANLRKQQLILSLVTGEQQISRKAQVTLELTSQGEFGI